ncbi:hypothetical protein NC653_037145 [Populus alba x Populus x berolinensis]|uniref:Uncharacterized protein n=1 Tax=Populus alba x Populus x berolinensis TaxID=444605 RepID=A0AAD6LLL8_9ROSI|nr:hypothetical protein NC653_037145 [Populus alba x Populus x berolinensis]
MLQCIFILSDSGEDNARETANWASSWIDPFVLGLWDQSHFSTVIPLSNNQLLQSPKRITCSKLSGSESLS